MPNLLVWHTDNRAPSITETITAGGAAVDISTASAKTFSMREVGSSTLTVDSQAASFVTDGTDGALRYDWAAGDVDTAGQYLVWWTVTIGGKTQDVGEAIIEIREHAPVTNAYVELESLKATLELTGESFADLDIRTALTAASRAVDEVCDRRFYPDTDASQVRYYKPAAAWLVTLDDVQTVTTFEVDNDGDGTFDTWTANDQFFLEPMNAAADGWPWTRAVINPLNSAYFNGRHREVKVTGKFGWPAVPAAITEATTILASRLVKRAREAPFGIAGFGIDGAAVRVARTDPDVAFLLEPYRRLVV
jgi:hypothetical protein